MLQVSDSKGSGFVVAALTFGVSARACLLHGLLDASLSPHSHTTPSSPDK